MKGSKTETKTETKKIEITSLNVLKAMPMKNSDDVMFNLEVNGITIYGMWYKVVTARKDGKEYEIISFPQTKGKNNSYYNVCYFPISDELKASIIEQLHSLVD